MNIINNYEYLLKDLSTLKGVGKKTALLLKKKKINTLFDILWKLPQSFTDRSKLTKISDLRIGETQSIKVEVFKYNFPRIRNLPNKVLCRDETGEIECIFFNSYEGYIRKILPINQLTTISGKVGFFKNKYQITNPKYVSIDDAIVLKKHNKYSLTEGISEKVYNKIIEQVMKNIPNLNEWHSEKIISIFNKISWKEAILKLHDPKNIGKVNSNFYRRLAYDEIFASFLISSEIRKKIKKIKKSPKKFENLHQEELIKKLSFKLTNDQLSALRQINIDLNNKEKMFRLLQGDVGSGKTIVALISGLNVINSGYQVAFMAPTEILAKQHFELAKKIFPNNINISLLTSKTENLKKKEILKDLIKNEINIIFGTHSLFQTKILFKKLGYIIIDEQHKFGVNQRKKLSDKGGKNCDILLMSATPIPRTLIMSVYGDMDITLIKEKPKNRKPIITYSKIEDKVNEVYAFIEKEIKLENQIFWVCPLIEESKKIDHASAVKKYEFLKKKYPGKVSLIHGQLTIEEKNKIINNFQSRKTSILVSTTVIEVGIDFPNATVIVIENANKFGLSQLHQLRGRVGRGNKQSTCILLFKSNLSENARKRIKILKSSNDGFVISEEDLELRGFGDVLGFKQSGIKNFKIADPILNKDLFTLGEKEIRRIENEEINISKFKPLLKLYDQADIINDIV